MKNEVKAKYNDPFLGLSSLKMDLASRGLSWAENIYQRLEKVCTDSDIVQISCKYVDAVGEEVRKMFDEVKIDWLNTSDGVDEPVSNLSMEQNVITDGEPKIFLSQRDTHGEPKKPSFPTEATSSNFSDGVGEDYINVLDPFSSPAALTSDLPSADEVRQSHQNELVEGGSFLSGFTSSTDIHDTCTSEETISFLGSLQKEHEQQIEPNKLEDSVRIPKNEISDGCDWEGVLNSSNEFHLNTEHMEVFEDVKVEDCWDDTENYELDLISHPTSMTISYKKKLWRTLISKVRSSKDRKQAGKFYDDVDMKIESRERIEASSVSSGDLYCKESTQNSCESDWELL